MGEIFQQAAKAMHILKRRQLASMGSGIACLVQGSQHHVRTIKTIKTTASGRSFPHRGPWNEAQEPSLFPGTDVEQGGHDVFPSSPLSLMVTREIRVL